MCYSEYECTMDDDVIELPDADVAGEKRKKADSLLVAPEVGARIARSIPHLQWKINSTQRSVIYNRGRYI